MLEGVLINSEKAEPIPFDQILPDEILLHILDFLILEKVIQLKLVSKNFYRLATDQRLQKSKFESNFKHRETSDDSWNPDDQTDYNILLKLAYCYDYVSLPTLAKILRSIVKENDIDGLEIQNDTKRKYIHPAYRDPYLIAQEGDFLAEIDFQDKIEYTLAIWLMEKKHQRLQNIFYNATFFAYCRDKTSNNDNPAIQVETSMSIAKWRKNRRKDRLENIDCKMQDEMGRTILYWALAFDQLNEEIGYLVSQGSSVREKIPHLKSHMPNFAIRQKRLDIIRNWFENDDTLLNWVSDNGFSPLLEAIKWNAKNIFDYLLHKKAGIPSNILFNVVSYNSPVTFAEALLQAKPELINEYNRGQLPIHFAAETGKVELLTLFAQVQSRHLFVPCLNGLTPLATAAEHNQKEAVRYLLQQPWLPNDGVNALARALTKQHDEVACMLINAGVSIETISDDLEAKLCLYKYHEEKSKSPSGPKLFDRDVFQNELLALKQLMRVVFQNENPHNLEPHREILNAAGELGKIYADLCNANARLKKYEYGHYEFIQVPSIFGFGLKYE